MSENIAKKRKVEPQEHHHQLETCHTRPAYRQGRKYTAVKTYTINDESTHLLVFGVPSIGLAKELKHACSKYGIVKVVKLVPDYPDVEAFTQVFHVQYLKLQSARFGKRKLDTMAFYGGILHVCYAPELETIEETRGKLLLRRKEVHFKLQRKQSDG